MKNQKLFLNSEASQFDKISKVVDFYLHVDTDGFDCDSCVAVFQTDWPICFDFSKLLPLVLLPLV